MNIQNAAILGAGAIGGYIYNQLYQNTKTWFIAAGLRKERLETNGIRVNDTMLYPTVKIPGEDHPDLLIVCLKYNALFRSLDEIHEICDDHTIVMSLLNGIDSEEVIRTVIDPDHVINAIVRVQVQRDGNSLSFNPASDLGIFYGAINEKQKETVEALNVFFDASALKHTCSDHILQDQWHKYALNISANLPQAVLNVGTGAYADSEHVRWLRDALAAEVLQVAEAYGIHIEEVRYGKWKPDGRLSTLQDLDAKRPTEIEMFLGVLIRKAKEKGISVPYSEYTYHAIKALEEKNTGKFNYGTR